MKSNTPKVVVITGGSSGIGLATAEYFVSKNWRVYELSRSGRCGEGIAHITADVTDISSLKRAFELISSQAGRIDVLVCNAGFGISGAIECTALEDAKRQMDVNFFGAVSAAQAAIPYLRESHGSIVNISSMGGPLALPFQAFYSCSKAAVNTFTLALANELQPFGISVCAVMPGDVRTGFTAAREKNDSGQELYGSRISKSISTMEHDEQSGMSPVRIAKCIYRASRQKHPRPLRTVGVQYKLFALLNKLLPASLVNRLIGMIYS